MRMLRAVVRSVRSAGGLRRWNARAGAKVIVAGGVVALATGVVLVTVVAASSAAQPHAGAVTVTGRSGAANVDGRCVNLARRCEPGVLPPLALPPAATAPLAAKEATQAKSVVLALRGTVQRCYAAGRSVNSCTSRKTLGIAAAMDGRHSDDTVVLGNPRGFAIQVTTSAGEAFDLSRLANGAVVRVCMPVRADGCGRNGQW